MKPVLCHWDIARGLQTLAGGSPLGRIWLLLSLESGAQEQRRLEMSGALLSGHQPLGLRQALPGSPPTWVLKQNSGETSTPLSPQGIPALFPDMALSTTWKGTADLRTE